MGVFDIFGKEPKTKNERANSLRGSFVEQKTTDKPNPISVFVPNSFEDVEKVIDALKAGKTSVVHLTELKTETALRILDMLSGAVYALDGGVYEMEKNIFMFSPVGVEVFDK